MTAADVSRMETHCEPASRDEWQRPDDVVALLEVTEGQTVVDLGAGTGYMLPHLSRAVGHGGHVIAIEVEPLLVEHLRQRVEAEHLTNVDVRLASREDPGLDNGSVDRILVLDTWPYIEDRGVYARHLERALRDGGFVLVIDVNEDAPHGPARGMRLLPHHIVSELHSGRFHAVEAEEELPYQWAVIGRPQR